VQDPIEKQRGAIGEIRKDVFDTDNKRPSIFELA
jgi:hypothetical protein